MVAIGLLALISGTGVGVAINWPALKRWWNPVPPDAVETVAIAYLDALKEGDSATVQRLGTVDLPPSIRSYRNLKRDKAADSKREGSFAPISAFHARVDQTYTFDPSAGRFVPKNALGPAAETLDALHEAKAKAEQEKIAEKIAGGSPDELFDAAESLAKNLGALSTGALSPRKLLPTYQMLVEDANPPLPDAEKTLALDFAQNRESWDALLKRPVMSLRADGPYRLERAEVRVGIIDRLGSSGDKPTPLFLTLTRFQLEGIDTGWRVTSTRRQQQPNEPPTSTTPAPPPRKPSPGESVPPTPGAAS